MGIDNLGKTASCELFVQQFVREKNASVFRLRVQVPGAASYAAVN